MTIIATVAFVFIAGCAITMVVTLVGMVVLSLKTAKAPPPTAPADSVTLRAVRPN